MVRARGKSRALRRRATARARARARAEVKGGLSGASIGSWLFQDDHFYRLIVVLAVLGLGFASYLTYLDFTHAHATFCEAGTGCDTVRESQYSTVLSVPVAVGGVLGYIAMIVVASGPFSERIKKTSLAVMATVGFTFSAYLTYREAFSIHAFCPYCVSSAVVMTAIFVLVHLRRPVVPGIPGPRLALVWAGLASCVVLGSVLLPSKISASPETTPTVPLAQAANPVQEPQEEVDPEGLAKHLQSIDAKLFGGYTCPRCAEQRELFGDAISYIDYYECHPEGKNSRSEACRSEGIVAWPTWLINGKLYLGLRSLEQLAKLSGYEGP